MSLTNRRKIFENTEDSQIIQQVSPQVPKILDSSIIQKQMYTSQTVQMDASKYLIQEISALQPNDLEQLLILFKQPQQINLELGNSSLQKSTHQQQFYEQLEFEGENIRKKLKQDARIVQSIIDKKNKIKSNHQKYTDLMNEMFEKIKSQNNVSKYSELSTTIKYNFNQLESHQLELREILSELQTFQNVICISIQHTQLQNSVTQQSNINETSESEFSSLSLKLYSEIEFHAKEFEQIISEKKRLIHISQNYHQYKQVCQSLIDSIQKYPQFEQQKTEQMKKLEKLAQIYFQHFQNELSLQIAKNSNEIEKIRLSLSVIDKMKFLLDQAKSYDFASEQYLEIESYLYDHSPIQSVISNHQLIKTYRCQFKIINLNSYSHFTILRNKIYTKCFIEFDQIQFQIKSTKNQCNELKTIIKQLKLYLKLNQFLLIKNALLSLEQNRQQLIWIHLINLYKQQLNYNHQLIIMQNNVNNIKEKNQSLERIKNKLNEIIDSELRQFEIIKQDMQKYLEIKDFNAQLQFDELEKEFKPLQVNFIKTKQKILSELNQYLIVQNSQLQMEKIQFHKTQLDNLQDLYPQVKQLQHKQLGKQIIQMKQQFEEMIQFHTDIIYLLETMLEILQVNFWFLVEDFQDIINGKTLYCLNFMNLVQQCIKRISDIKYNEFQQIRGEQLRQFQWLWVYLEMLQKQKQQISLLFQNSDQQYQFILLSKYQSFQEKQQFCNLFLQLNKCGRKVFNTWFEIQKVLSQITFKVYLTYEPQILDRIVLDGNGYSLNTIQFNEQNCQKIMEFLENEETTQQQIQISMHQLYRKMKQMDLSHIEKFQNIKEFYERYINEQQQDDSIDASFFINTEFNATPKKYQKMYSKLQEQWLFTNLDKLDKQQLQDLKNQENMFNLEFMDPTIKIQKLINLLKQDNLSWQEIQRNLNDNGIDNDNHY